MVYLLQHLEISPLCSLPCRSNEDLRWDPPSWLAPCRSGMLMTVSNMEEVPQHIRMGGGGGVSRVLLAFVSALKFQVAWACFTWLLIPDWCWAGKQPWATACQTSDRWSPGATVSQTSVELDPVGPESTYANITLMLLKWLLYMRTQRYALPQLRTASMQLRGDMCTCM